MTQLLAWVWAPLLIYVVALGFGLLLERVLRIELPSALLAPAGLAVVVVVTVFLYRAGLEAIVPIALAVAAVAGLALGRDGIGRWLPGPALTAGGLVYALYMAPIVLTGDALWAGYNFVNDTASNFVLADALEQHGTGVPVVDSGTAANAANLLGSGYPLGAFSTLAGLRPLSGVPLESFYQPFMATVAGLAAMGLTEIGSRAGLRRWSAVIAAAAALGGVLLYRYVLHGAVKEILVVELMITAVALAAVTVERRLEVRWIVPVALSCLAMIFVFSVAAGAYAAALAVAAAVAVMTARERPSMREVGRLLAIGGGLMVVVLLPVVGSTLDFVTVIDQVFSSSGGVSEGKLGQLLRPLPATEAAGVWLGRDYRVEAEGPAGLNTVLVTAVIVAAGAGVALALRRRAKAPLMLLAVAGLPALALSPFSSPYIDAKLLVVLTPAVVWLASFAAFTGIQARGIRWRVVGAVGLVLVLGGVAGSDLYAYRDARAAPAARV